MFGCNCNTSGLLALLVYSISALNSPPRKTQTLARMNLLTSSRPSPVLADTGIILTRGSSLLNSATLCNAAGRSTLLATIAYPVLADPYCMTW